MIVVPSSVVANRFATDDVINSYDDITVFLLMEGVSQWTEQFDSHSRLSQDIHYVHCTWEILNHTLLYNFSESVVMGDTFADSIHV